MATICCCPPDNAVLAGLTPTAGGVLFGGDNAGTFLVFDGASGKILKKDLRAPYWEGRTRSI